MPQLKYKEISICYETFGKSSNPAIILITGISGQLIYWPQEFTQGLADQGFFVITFDNRDAGLSSYYDHLETPSVTDVIKIKQQGETFYPPYTLQDMAADIIILLDSLGIAKTHVVGISLGGMIAQVFAMDYPERILSLTFMQTTTGDVNLPPSKPRVLQFFFTPKQLPEDLSTYVADMLQIHKLYNHPDHFNENYFRDLFTKAYQRAYHPEGSTRQLLAIMGAAPRGEQLKKLPIPSLVIHGDYDPVFPLEHGKELAACLPNSHLEIIADMGHGLPDAHCAKLVDLIATHVKAHTK